MTKPTLLGISGSLRKASTNTALINEAARLFGDCNFSMGDIRMPLYDGDVEEVTGLPEEAKTLIAQLNAADAVIIATPEYNSALPGVLKNALDWISRDKPRPLAGKPTAILSAAAGRSGGGRAQFSLRHCLTAFNPMILQAPEVMIAASYAAFDDKGHLKDGTSQDLLTTQMAALRALIP